jgi:leader peptidase (prepilin peptidase)/N-methyltransferase
MELNALEWAFGLVFCFIAGACVGSFLNVCIYRWPLGMSTNVPRRSICMSCQAEIPWKDNLPILSWFLLKGKCRNCGEPFSVRYSLVELLTGVLCAHIFFVYGLSWATFLYIVWTAMQIVGSFIDLDHTILPDRITLVGGIGFPLAILALDLAGQSGSLFVSDWKNALWGALFASGFIYSIRFLGTLAFGREAMGLGDVKLMLMNGAILGAWRSLFVIMGLGPILAILTIVLVRLATRKKVERHMEIPYGPFLCLGSYVALFWGDPLGELWLGEFWYEWAVLLDEPWRWFGW